MDNKPQNNIDELLKTHGKRVQPDELMAQRAKNNIRTHWQASVVAQRKRSRIMVFQIAAVVMLMVTIGLFIGNKDQTPFTNTIYLQGELLVSEDGESWKVNKQESLSWGVWLKTGSNSFTNLTLTDNSQLRLNQNTQIQLLSQTKIKLVDGEIYHDADDVTIAKPLTVNTSLGDITHVGTRYLVNKSKDILQVSVRNGLVEISDNQITRQLTNGKQLNLHSSGEQRESTIAPYDSIWNWTQIAAQPFVAKDKSLYNFINWYAHENGYEINWNQQQLKTKRVKLSGELSMLDKTQQIKTVFLSTKFDYKINKGILTILK